MLLLRGGVAGPVDKPAAPDAPAAEDPGAAILKDATALAAAGKHAEAHEKALSIPESSPSRNDPAFADQLDVGRVGQRADMRAPLQR